MPPRLPLQVRKLIGTLVLLTGMVVYVFFAIAFAGHYVPRHWLAEGVYFLIAGVAWAFPARYLINWMLRPDPLPRDEAES